MWINLNAETPLAFAAPVPQAGAPAVADIVPDTPAPAPVSVSIGDLIQFGAHDWRVLDVQGSRALIITENVIMQREFGGLPWQGSLIRHYLNSTFFNTFSPQDQARIAETNVAVSINPLGFGLSGFVDSTYTTDRIFLLSIEEVVRYFGDSGLLAEYSNEAFPISSISDNFNSARVARDLNGTASSWWLRTPGLDGEGAVGSDFDPNVASVWACGTIFTHGDRDMGTTNGIRPVLWLNLDR